MNTVHVHLLLNHFPVIGTIIGLALLAIGWARRNDALVRASLWLFAALALVAVVVYLTGEPAEDAVKHTAGFSDTIAERHEDAALIALIALGAFGVGALGVLWRFRRRAIPRGVAAAALAFALVPAALMGWTANTGGQIRHTEIRAGAQGAQPVPRANGDRAEDGGR
ncbi:MAG TPA: DUF2231 domain-containing protein [Gemmatimonadaceae bacterium]|nr:DUF2231 domain-containing protein [Gemmatimonadaceae bacterium]